jgi:hypothetical protein
MKSIMLLRVAACLLPFFTSVAVGGTIYIGSQSSLEYGPSRYATFAGNQTLSTDDATGYITSGVLAFAQNLYYGPSRSLNFSAYPTTFAGGYVESGKPATTGQSAY